MLRSLLSNWLLIVQVLGRIVQMMMLGVKHYLRRQCTTRLATRWTPLLHRVLQTARDSPHPLIRLRVARQGMHLSRPTRSPRVRTSAPSQTRPRARQDMLLTHRKPFPKERMSNPFRALQEADPLVMDMPLSPLNRSPRLHSPRLKRRLASGFWRTCMLPRRAMIHRVRLRLRRRKRHPVPIVRGPSQARRTWQVSGHRDCMLEPLLGVQRAQRGPQPYRLLRGDR